MFDRDTPIGLACAMTNELVSIMREIAPTDPAFQPTQADVLAVAGMSARATVRAGMQRELRFIGEA